jgi:hypothetical protein
MVLVKRRSNKRDYVNTTKQANSIKTLEPIVNKVSVVVVSSVVVSVVVVSCVVVCCSAVVVESELKVMISMFNNNNNNYGSC